MRAGLLLIPLTLLFAAPVAGAKTPPRPKVAVMELEDRSETLSDSTPSTSPPCSVSCRRGSPSSSTRCEAPRRTESTPTGKWVERGTTTDPGVPGGRPPSWIRPAARWGEAICVPTRACTRSSMTPVTRGVGRVGAGWVWRRTPMGGVEPRNLGPMCHNPRPGMVSRGARPSARTGGARASEAAREAGERAHAPEQAGSPRDSDAENLAGAVRATRGPRHSSATSGSRHTARSRTRSCIRTPRPGGTPPRRAGCSHT